MSEDQVHVLCYSYAKLRILGSFQLLMKKRDYPIRSLNALIVPVDWDIVDHCHYALVGMLRHQLLRGAKEPLQASFLEKLIDEVINEVSDIVLLNYLRKLGDQNYRPGDLLCNL